MGTDQDLKNVKNRAGFPASKNPKDIKAVKQQRKSRLLARTLSTELKDDDDGSRWGNARRSGRRSTQKDEKCRNSHENLRRRVSVVACQIGSDVWDWCLRNAGNDRVRSHGTPTTIKLPQTLFH